MTLRAALAAAALLGMLLSGTMATPDGEDRLRAQQLDLLRLMMERPWLRPPDNPPPNYDDLQKVSDDDTRVESEKRSAVATALNSGRRRRQPAPALGVLNDMGSFFDALRDNIEALASLSPQQRSTLFQEPPHVVNAPLSGGGGSGIRRLHALRPLRPAGNIRSYNRRSFVEGDGGYPGANHHDPGLLWTGLGR